MNRQLISRAAVLSLIIALVFSLAPDAAWAVPGGIIKAAARSPWGRILFGALAIILLPVIIYFMVVRALAIRRTRQALARLAAVYPQYRWLEIKDRVIDTFNWTWSAWTQQKMSLADDYVTHWYRQNQQLQLDEWARRGVENVCHVVSIKDIVPLFVQHTNAASGEGSRLTVSITARVVDYLQDTSTGQVVQGDKKEGDLETIWSFVWQEGTWRLNLIEESAQEWSYLGMKNEVPETIVAPQRVP